MTLIDGKGVSIKIKEAIRGETHRLKDYGEKTPGIAVIIVGSDPASQVYVNNKIKACKEVGIRSYHYSLGEKVSQNELLALIEKLNHDNEVDGILVQQPLPVHLNNNSVIEAIDPLKDVDCFHPQNIGKLLSNSPYLLPCTPAGIIRLLDEYHIAIEGKRVVIIGRSNIVGKPSAILFLHRHATVTICHSRTIRLGEIAKEADILVAAVGKANFVKGDMVKDGAVVIDVGINRIDGRLTGDVEFDSVSGKVSYITPVPGGVGPMTIAMLLQNTLDAFKHLKNYL